MERSDEQWCLVAVNGGGTGLIVDSTKELMNEFDCCGPFADDVFADNPKEPGMHAWTGHIVYRDEDSDLVGAWRRASALEIRRFVAGRLVTGATS